jgi:hypothetical protein
MTGGVGRSALRYFFFDDFLELELFFEVDDFFEVERLVEEDFFALDFLLLPFFDDVFFELVFLLEEAFFEEDFLDGTLPPAALASDSPMAIACFLLVTFLPEPPLFSVPLFRSCIAFSTFSEAFSPYLAMNGLLSGRSFVQRPSRE